MKTKSCLLFIMFLLFALVVVAAAQYIEGIFIDKGFADGNKYLSMNEEAKRTYVCGIRDGILLANILMMKDRTYKEILSTKESISAITEYSNNVPAGQLNAIVDKYMRDNPHKWNDPMNVLVFGALAESLLKSKKGK